MRPSTLFTTLSIISAALADVTLTVTVTALTTTIVLPEYTGQPLSVGISIPTNNIVGPPAPSLTPVPSIPIESVPVTVSPATTTIPVVPQVSVVPVGQESAISLLSAAGASASAAGLPVTPSSVVVGGATIVIPVPVAPFTPAAESNSAQTSIPESTVVQGPVSASTNSPVVTLSTVSSSTHGTATHSTASARSSVTGSATTPGPVPPAAGAGSHDSASTLLALGLAMFAGVLFY